MEPKYLPLEFFPRDKPMNLVYYINNLNTYFFNIKLKKWIEKRIPSYLDVIRRIQIQIFLFKYFQIQIRN